MYLTNRNIAYFLLIMIFLISGCGGGSTSSATEETSANTVDSTNTTSNPVVTIEPSNKATHSGQVKDSSTGNGLANVRVSIGTVSTTTDENGFYSFTDLNTSDETTINYEKDGYLLGSTNIQFKSFSPNYVEHNLYLNNYHLNRESTQEISSPRIFFDDSVNFVNNQGHAYIGTMIIDLTILDNNKKSLLSAMPGTFKGKDINGDIKQLETYGLINLSFHDTEGNTLDLSGKDIGSLTFPEVSFLDEKPDTLPLWYYDKKQGLWIEEGYAELQDDGSYKGDIPHLGIWSLNKAIETDPGIYRGRIVSEDGSPMSDVRLHAIGDNWISSDLSIDQDGFFEIEVNPGSSFRLSAYDYKNKYGANYNGTIPAIASGEIVED